MKTAERLALTQPLVSGINALGLNLSERRIGQMMDYLALLTKWNAVYNLTAVRDPVHMVTQHLLDSLAAVPAFDGAGKVLDVGAGGGLPGIVLAIACPEIHISLVDTVHKKTAFLMQVKGDLDLRNVAVHTARVEQLQVNEKFDVITSRAFAELSNFVSWSGHHLAEGGCFIAMMGKAPQQEQQQLPTGWVITEIRPLHVPGLDAARHLVFVRKSALLAKVEA